MIRKRGHRVPATSIAKVRELAGTVRRILEVLGSPGTGKVDVLGAMEFYLPDFVPDFCLEVVEDGSMGDDHARTYPDSSRIMVQRSTYEGARSGNGRDIFTLAHELGHLFLHRGVAAYARSASSESKPKIFEDSEWQADTFAAEFLMPYDECKDCASPEEISRRFGVSFTAARVRFRNTRN